MILPLIVGAYAVLAVSFHALLETRLIIGLPQTKPMLKAMTKRAILQFICGFKPRTQCITLLSHLAQRRGRAVQPPSQTGNNLCHIDDRRVAAHRLRILMTYRHQLFVVQ